MINTDQFFQKMLKYFPYLETEYIKNIDRYGELLSTVVIEDIFMPEIIQIIKKDTEISKLTELFDYLEMVVELGDEKLINIISVTMLEILGNDRDVLNLARKYMGPKTIEMQILADKDLGRVIDWFKKYKL